MVPGLAAGLALGGLNLIGALSTNEANKDIAESNNSWSAAQYAKRYQVQNEDLKAAGLNPMLAYSQIPGSAPTAQQVTLQNPMSSATEGFAKGNDAAVKEAQVANILADTRVKDETAKQIVAQTEAAEAQARLSTASANEATVRMVSQQNYGNPAQKALAEQYWSQVNVNKANLPKIASEIVSNGAFAAQARAQAEKAIAERNITRADLDRALNDQRYERSTGGVIRQTARDLGSITSAGKAAADADRARMPMPSRRR
jgi:hypothetical protein